MTMNVMGRKARLLATGMAVSLFAMSGAAHAGSTSNGTFSKTNLGLTKEAVGVAKPAVTLTADQQAALDSAANAKTTLTNLVLATRNSTTFSTQTAYATALSTEKAAITTAATAAKTLTTAETTKATADALAATLLVNKTTAAAKVTAALAAETAAFTAYNALTSSATAAEITAAVAASDKAFVARVLAEAESAPVATAYTAAQTAATTALNDYTTAINGKATADSAVINATATRTNAAASFNTALTADTNFASVLEAVNAAAGTTFVASYDGLVAIAAYDDAETAPTYASNGYTRTTTTLASAAASTNTNISLASGALTGSTAALDVGANYETEVLGALVNHEGRITVNEAGVKANTTAITALDVRTTANTTAITALDVRTTANTTAITAETAARIAADNKFIAEDTRLAGLITTETTARLAQNTELRNRIASSTATAIALGGAALLPDMGFTLSGNVAIYEGAQAIALNAAANVAPNAFITAAVGGGLNKNGSVGARVGFVLGFK